MTDFMDLLQKRRSTRKFKDQPVEEEKITKILEAALMAPSSKRCMPWHFVVVDEKETLKKLAESRQMGSKFLEGAPLAIIVLAEEEKSDVWVEDASIAAILMQLEVEDLGLGSCWVQIRQRSKDETISTEKYLQTLINAPDGLRMECMIAIGYKDEEKKPFDKSKLLLDRIHRNSF